MKNRIIGILLTALMVLGSVPFGAIPAFAASQEPVSYRAYDPASKTYDETKVCTSYTEVKEDTTSWKTGWYVVNQSVTITDSVYTDGNVNLILMDDCTLTVTKRLVVNSDVHLTVFAQSDGEGMGALDAQRGIGGDSKCGGGTITFHGGTITATGGANAAGIGGGTSSGCGDVTVYGGDITAKGGLAAGGIGGYVPNVGSVMIYGGTVRATGGPVSQDPDSALTDGINSSYLNLGGTVYTNGELQPSYKTQLLGSTGGQTIGTPGETSYYYVSTDVRCIAAQAGVSGLSIAEGATVYINVLEDAMLICYGGDANSQVGGGAGILVPGSSALYLVGTGTVAARGGRGANGGGGGRGRGGFFNNPTQKMYAGNGGDGGFGGGGGGAGIGTAGGRGGDKGIGGIAPYAPQNTDMLTPPAGTNGQDGTPGAAVGTISIASSLSLYATGGTAGVGGSSGTAGSQGLDVGSGWENNHTAGAGGGGGGGQGGGKGADIGTGGAGGGGGAGGNSGGIIYTTGSGFYHIRTLGGYGGGNYNGSADLNDPIYGRTGSSETNLITKYAPDRTDKGEYKGYVVAPRAYGGRGGAFGVETEYEHGQILFGSNGGQTIGKNGTESYYSVFADTSCTAGAPGASGLTIADGATVRISVVRGATLICAGGNGSEQTGGGAGILVPKNAELYLDGDGTVRATGGNAGNATAGKKGEDGYFAERKNWLDITVKTYYGGTGGAGGNGGGGAGAGIGSAGGRGGNGGAGGARDGGDREEDHVEHKPGGKGGDGAYSAAIGTVQVRDTVKLIVKGGAEGTRANGALNGWSAYEAFTNNKYGYSAGGSGGGGGGQGGGKAAAIGTGGQGGGGGAGGNGAGTVYSDRGPRTINSYGGLGGGNTDGNATGENIGGTGHDCNNTYYPEIPMWSGYAYYARQPGGAGGAAGIEHEHVFTANICEICTAYEFADDGFEATGDGILTKYTGKEKNVIFPDRIYSVADNVFKDSKTMESVTLSPVLTEIGSSSFFGTKLTCVLIPGSVTKIGHNAFQNCTALTAVDFEDSEEPLVILNSTFAGTGLKSLDIPLRVSSIGYNAFQDCTDLQSVTVHWTNADDIVSPLSNAFGGVPADCELHVPYGMTDSYLAHGWSLFSGHIIEAEPPHVHDFSGEYVINDDGTHTQKCTGCEEYSEPTVHVWASDVEDMHVCACGFAEMHSDEDSNNLCDVCCAVLDKTRPTLTGISLTLSSDISMNFYMFLPEDAAQSGKMTFTVGERTVKGTLKTNENGTYFTCPLTVLEMAEDVTATFRYNGTDYVRKRSVMDYLSSILEGGYPEEVRTLVYKITNYGSAAQAYLASIHDSVIIGDGGYAEVPGYSGKFATDVEAAAVLTDTFLAPAKKNGIKLYARTVYFDSATALNYYIETDDGEAPTAV